MTTSRVTIFFSVAAIGVLFAMSATAAPMSASIDAPAGDAHAGTDVADDRNQHIFPADLSSPLWRDADRLTTQCVVNGATQDQHAIICRKLLAAAKINAPIDVQERFVSVPQAANEVSLVLNGTVDGSDFIGTVGLSRSALRGEHSDASQTLPISLDLKDKGSRADHSIHAALVRLLPWRQLKRATHSPPREY